MESLPSIAEVVGVALVEKVALCIHPQLVEACEDLVPQEQRLLHIRILSLV